MSSKQTSAETSRETDDRSLAAGVALGVVGVAAFSLTLPLTRLAVAEFDVWTIVVWRALIASAAAAAALVVFRAPPPRRTELGAYALCAGGVVVGFPLLTTLGLRTTPAGHAAVVVGLLPIATAIAAVALAGERPSLRFWAASGLGAAITAGFALAQSGSADAGPGHLLLAAAVVVAAIGYAVGGRLSRHTPGWRVISWSLAFSAPLALAAAAFTPPPSLTADVEALVALGYLGLVSQWGGFIAFYAGLALGGVARVGQTQLLQVFLTLLAATAVNGEPLETESLLAGGAVVLCVAAAMRSRQGGR